MAILAAMIVPSMSPDLAQQLQAAAQRIVADLDHARSLAVTHNSTYRVTLDIGNNRYILEHTGSDSSLDSLPEGPFRDPNDPADQHIVLLDELPSMGGGAVELLAVEHVTAIQTVEGEIEFGPLGETTSNETATIWLQVGDGSLRRYLSIEVDPVSGLSRMGSLQASNPGVGAVSSP
jgi:Tfp pilus assembly protein FimT